MRVQLSPRAFIYLGGIVMKYNKLVCDKIPEIIEETGQTPITHRAS
ncbi:MAG: hypothetical protein AB1465_05080 [Patescibacteria group bacterium]